MKFLLIFFLLLAATLVIHAQKPKDGKYTYTIAFAEWQGKSLGETCTVVIKGDSITVTYSGQGKLTGTKKGDIIDKG